MPLSASIREVVRARATFQCEYCQSAETLSGMKCEVDHIVPKSRGGSDDLDNLCAACALCNGRKYTKTDGIDPDTMQRAQLFDPREQAWHEHFRWNETGTIIIGLTVCGSCDSQRIDVKRSVTCYGTLNLVSNGSPSTKLI